MEVTDELLELWLSEDEEGDRASTGPSTNKTKRETNASLISILLNCNSAQSLLSYFYAPSSSVDGKLVFRNICNSSIVKPCQNSGHPTKVFRKISVPHWKFSWLARYLFS